MHGRSILQSAITVEVSASTEFLRTATSSRCLDRFVSSRRRVKSRVAQKNWHSVHNRYSVTSSAFALSFLPEVKRTFFSSEPGADGGVFNGVEKATCGGTSIQGCEAYRGWPRSTSFFTVPFCHGPMPSTYQLFSSDLASDTPPSPRT